MRENDRLRLVAALITSLLGLAASCGGGAGGAGDSVVIVHVDGPAGLPALFQLRAILSNAGVADTKLFPAMLSTKPIPLPTAFSVTLPATRAGNLDVALDALDAQAAVVASGAGSVPVKPGGRAEVSITLVAGASLCGNGHLDPGEECDDGDRISNGTCDFRCHRPVSVVVDAGAETGGCSLDLLANGAFDAGDVGWTAVSAINQRLIYAAGDQALGGFAPSSPSYLALLGRNLLSGEETLSQSVRIPAAASTIMVVGLFHLSVNPATTCLTCNAGGVDLVEGATTIPVESWTGQDGNSGWTTFTKTVDAVPLRNTTATFRLRATATSGFVTPLFFDSLAVNVDRCGP
jgi:cysteine-rich repeat protein